jgi:hypothetical protein
MDGYANGLSRKVRLTSLDSYGVGTLVIIDVIHIPYGCSVSLSFHQCCHSFNQSHRYGLPFGPMDYKENGQTQEK